MVSRPGRAAGRLGMGTPGGYRWGPEVPLPARLRLALARAAAALCLPLVVACGGPPAPSAGSAAALDPAAGGPRAVLLESDALTDALAAGDLDGARASAARLRPAAAALGLASA
ncbi:MAG: hypothetical protein RL071_616, partial [Pseudomonadota bacterium]